MKATRVDAATRLKVPVSITVATEKVTKEGAVTVKTVQVSTTAIMEKMDQRSTTAADIAGG